MMIRRWSPRERTAGCHSQPLETPSAHHMASDPGQNARKLGSAQVPLSPSAKEVEVDSPQPAGKGWPRARLAAAKPYA